MKQYSNSIKHLSAKSKNLDDNDTADMSEFGLRSKSSVFYEEDKNVFKSHGTGSHNPEDDIEDLLSSDDDHPNIPANI